MTSTAVAKAAAPSRAVAIKTDEDLRGFLLERAPEFAVLAKAAGVEAEVLVAELVVAARKKPEILTCTPESIVNFMYDSAKTGLVVGKGCFPVPVRDNKAGVTNLECWIGYKGARELVIYGRGARDVYAYVVFEGDYFEELLGSFSEVKHKPGPNFGNMAKAIGVYAVAVISQTVHRHIYLSKDKVERLRRMNRGNTTSPSSPWVAHTEAMWKAKAVLALCRDLPSNPRLAQALSILARTEGIDPDDLNDGGAREPTADAQPRRADPEPAEFEVVEEVPSPAPFTLPNWRGHPLSNKTLDKCETPALEQLHKELRTAADRGDNRFAEVLERVSIELDERRNKAA